MPRAHLREILQLHPKIRNYRKLRPGANSNICSAIFISVAFAAELMLTLFVQVYKAVNKKSKNYLSTPMNISRLTIELAHLPDKEFYNYLLSGLSHGFNSGVECALSQNFISNILQSAHAEPDVIDDLIKKEVKSGFMIGPFDKPPFEVFRVSPIGVATRTFSGKKRLIIDLSSPHNSTVPSINSLIPLDKFSLRYHDNLLSGRPGSLID